MGDLLPTDYPIPNDAVETLDTWTLRLRPTDEEVLGQAWDEGSPTPDAGLTEDHA